MEIRFEKKWKINSHHFYDVYRALTESNFKFVEQYDPRWVNSIYYDNDFSALNSISINNSKKFRIENIKKIKIKTKIFSDIVKENFDFLNIDAEGEDFKILKTINLKRFTPKLINIEVEPANKKNIYKYLKDNGYKILKIKSASHIFTKTD